MTRAVASLTESGAIERYRRIHYILVYGGGTIRFVAARVKKVGMDVFSSFLKTLIRYLRRTMQLTRYDFTATTDSFAWRALSGHAKPSHILLGSNFPWTSSATFGQQRADLQAKDDPCPKSMQALERINALKLFPRFA